MRRISVLVGVIVLGLSGIAAAQLAVQEVGQNLTYNGIQAAEAVFQTAEWILDLTALEEYIFPEGAAEDLEQLVGLAEEAEELSFDLGSLEALLTSLFDPESAPSTSFEYRQRVIDINQTLYQTYRYAMRTQSLIATTLRTVEHIMGFMEQVAGLTGKLSAQQNLAQQVGKLHQLETEAKVQRTAFERAMSLAEVSPVVLEQSIQNIVDQMMSDHPRW